MSIARTSGSGLVDRNESDNGSFPFATGEWTVPTGWSKSLISGELVIQSSGNHAPNWMTRDMTALGEMMVYSRAAVNNALQFGVGVLVSNITAGSQDGIEGACATGFSGGRFLTYWTAGSVTTIDSTGSGIDVTSPSRISLWADANNAAMYDFEGAAGESGTYPSAKTGEPGVFCDFAATGQQFNVQKFFVFNGRYVVVTGLTAGSGQKAKIRKSDGTVLASATESGGTATIDCLTIEEWWNVHNLAITTSADAVIEQNIGDVWAGETWLYTPSQVTGAHRASTVTLYAPTVTRVVSVAFIASTATLFGPSIPGPSQPTITATATGPRSVTVEGSAYSSPGSVPIGAVEWRIATNSGMSAGVQTFTVEFDDPLDAPTPLTYGWADLEPATAYWFDVRYQDNAGTWSPRSAAVSETTDTEAPPNTPTIVSATVGTDSVALGGSAFSDPLGRTHVKSRWQIATAAGSYASPVNENLEDVSGLTSETFLGLTPGTAYKARLQYVADDGSQTAWSADKLFTTLTAPANRPNQPTASIDQITQTSFRVTGSAYVNPTGSPHSRTQIFVTNYPSGGTFGMAYRVLDVNVAAPGTPYTVSGLTAGTLYNVAIRYQALDGAWSDWSAWTPATTTAAPLAGALLQVTRPRQGAVVRGTAVEMAWTPASEAGSTFTLEYSADNGITWLPIASGIASAPYSWNVSGLTDGVYKWRVKAVEGAEVTGWQYGIVVVDNANLLASEILLFNYNAEAGTVDGDWVRNWFQTGVTWAVGDGGDVRYNPPNTQLIESAFSWTGSFKPRAADIIGEVMAGSLGGSFPWNWFPEQAQRGVGFFADGGATGVNPLNGIAATIDAVPISAFGTCEVRGSGDGFLNVAAYEGGARILAARIPIGRVHVVNLFDGCNKVPRYGVRLRISTIAELGNGRRRLRLQVHVTGRGVTLPADGWHYQNTLETGLDCGRACFVGRNINTTNGPYGSFSNLTVMPYEYGACEAPLTFPEPEDVETCPPPIFDLTIFEEDDVTPVFGSVDDYGDILEASFSTWPDHPRPWLHRWTAGSEHEVDVRQGGSSIGALMADVIDKRVNPCDQQSGFLTSYGAEDDGFSAYIGRRAIARERLSDGTFNVVHDGPITEVTLLDTLVTYRFRIASMRERERDVPVFDTQYQTFSAYPWGPLNGYGLLGVGSGDTPIYMFPAAPIATGTYERLDANPLEGVIFGRINNASVFTYAARSELSDLGDPEPVFDEVGFAGRFYLKFILRWRYPGDDDTEWRYVYDMPAGVSSNAINAFSVDDTPSIFQTIFDWPAVVLINAALNATFEDEATLPIIDSEVEFQILANAEPSEAFPFVYDGTFGDLLRRVYDGEFSPSDPRVIYDVACMDAFEAAGPVARMWKTDGAEDDLRAWVEQNIYQPSGWLPGMNEDGSICPVDAAVPDGSVSLVTLDNALVIRANWSQDGSRAVPIASIKIFRDFIGIVSDDPEQLAFITQSVEVQRIATRGAESLKSKALIMEPETLRSLGGVYREFNGEFANEEANLFALERVTDIVGRYAFGPQIVAVRVRDTAVTRQLLVGTWVILDVDWIPNLATLLRGGPQLGLIVSRKKDPGLAWDLTLILGGSAASGLNPPTMYGPEVVGGGGSGGGGPIIIDVDPPESELFWDFDPGAFANEAALRADTSLFIPSEDVESSEGGASGAYSLNASPPAGAISTKTLRYTYTRDNTPGAGGSGCKSITITKASTRWTPFQELWIEFRIRWSANFRTTNADCPPNDHKLFFVDTVSDESGRWAIYVGAGVGPGHSIGVERPRDPDLGPGFEGGKACNLNSGPEILPYPDLWDGNWHLFRFYVRHSTTTNSDDGAMRLWVDGRKIHDESGFNTCKSAADGNGPERLNGISFCHNEDDGPINTVMTIDWDYVSTFVEDAGW